MSALASSPGPMRPNIARLSDKSINVAHVVDADGSAVAQLHYHGDERTVANANLFAAAPELYEALIEAKRTLWDTARRLWTLEDFKNWAVVQQIDAALTKAHPNRGEP